MAIKARRLPGTGAAALSAHSLAESSKPHNKLRSPEPLQTLNSLHPEDVYTFLLLHHGMIEMCLQSRQGAIAAWGHRPGISPEDQYHTPQPFEASKLHRCADLHYTPRSFLFTALIWALVRFVA